MTLVIDRKTDPISVRVTRDSVWLQVGEGRGSVRHAVLNAQHARLVAYALLAAAEKASSS